MWLSTILRGVGLGLGVSSGKICSSFTVHVFDNFLEVSHVVSSIVCPAWPSFWLALAYFLVSLILGLLNESNNVCFIGLPAGAVGLLPLHANILVSIQ